jgi:hypothetical protein
MPLIAQRDTLGMHHFQSRLRKNGIQPIGEMIGCSYGCFDIQIEFLG